eukprot:2817461-Prymnesium_polylepis.1
MHSKCITAQTRTAAPVPCRSRGARGRGRSARGAGRRTERFEYEYLNKSSRHHKMHLRRDDALPRMPHPLHTLSPSLHGVLLL